MARGNPFAGLSKKELENLRKLHAGGVDTARESSELRAHAAAIKRRASTTRRRSAGRDQQRARNRAIENAPQPKEAQKAFNRVDRYNKRDEIAAQNKRAPFKGTPSAKNKNKKVLDRDSGNRVTSSSEAIRRAIARRRQQRNKR